MPKIIKPTYLAYILVPLAICIAGLAGAYIFPRLTIPASPLPTSTLQPLDSPALTPSPTGPVNLTYTKPTDWKTIKINPLKISLCLPPDWSFKSPNQIMATFQNKPISIINLSVYSSSASGSLKDRYLSLKSLSPSQQIPAPPKSTIDEFFINSFPAIFASIPGNSDVVVVPVENQLVEFSQGNLEPFTNTISQFQTSFFTMIGCTKPLLP